MDVRRSVTRVQIKLVMVCKIDQKGVGMAKQNREWKAKRGRRKEEEAKREVIKAGEGWWGELVGDGDLKEGIRAHIGRRSSPTTDRQRNNTKR